MSGGEPLELCEGCGSPTEGDSCRNCGGGSREGASPVGAAPLDRRELSRVLGRSVGVRAHGSYALSIQQAEGMAPMRREIESLVERFNASAEVKQSARLTAERLAAKVMGELGPTRAAIASVAQVFIGQGRNFIEVSRCISKVHPAMDRLRDLIVEVYPAPSGEIRVLVDGRERPFRSYSRGIYRKLRIPLFTSDGDALLELKNARLTQRGFDAKRVGLLGPSGFRVRADERTFELFKILEEARLSGKNAPVGTDFVALLRKYSVSKLPLTQKLLRETGLLRQVTGEYVRLFTLQVGNGRGRSPRKLAEEALVEACTMVIPTCLSNSVSWKYHLKQSGMKSLIVTSELTQWRG
ncbi:MAG TPA: hypothetical protein VGR53_06565 [Nitrososphaerales archaeon]|nr:hypothetical protein [Nitrososphaerales archaeon]